MGAIFIILSEIIDKNRKKLCLCRSRSYHRYWERVQERSREGNTNSKTTPAKTPNQYSSTSGNNSTQQQKGQSDAKTSRLAVPEKTPNTTKPDLSGKLDSHGKLTAKERQYLIDNNLCLFCGKKGHRVTNCLSVKASTAKGRAATTTPAASVLGQLRNDLVKI